ncbi:unnamed protein product [Brugia pahangi]|uniref:BED-type domain-containing protein n=1 Tax=Brugia pahangi TaxID=6280 RepID=A0A0N4TNX9_BRUPA|nr:unnamed protein product [Brugia pahangi]
MSDAKQVTQTATRVQRLTGRKAMSTSSVMSGNSTKSTGCNSIAIAPPIVPSQYNAKNAGRKKTNPVWNFFVDLKTKGLSGVRCRYCEWITNDRSPTTLKFHLKRKHDTGLGGIWNIVEERIGINQPQGRSRFVVNNRNGETAAFVIPVDTEMRPEPDREQHCYPECYGYIFASFFVLILLLISHNNCMHMSAAKTSGVLLSRNTLMYLISHSLDLRWTSLRKCVGTVL